jgi:hypothetical protein
LVQLVEQELEVEDQQAESEPTPVLAELGQNSINRSLPAAGNVAINKELLDMMNEEDDEAGGSPSPVVDLATARHLRSFRAAKEITAYRKWALTVPAGASDSEVFSFYKKHSLEFSTICRLARAYLALQASSAATERLFSIGGNTCTGNRFVLGDEIVSSIVFAKGSIDQVCGLDARGNPIVIPTATGLTVGVKGPQPRSTLKRPRSEGGAFEAFVVED